MKTKFTIALLALSINTFAQFSLNLTNGYGGGIYNAGDTVDIWAKESPTTQYFKNWSGDIVHVLSVNCWHNRVVMPSANVNLTANYDIFTAPASYGFEWIQGEDTLKPVYYAFPNPSEIIGVVHLFHGTNGNAGLWVNNFEKNYTLKRLVTEKFGVIITECEETTRNIDFNSDGVHRWNYSMDTLTNVDILNIKAITDTFRLRGLYTNTIPQLAFGVSAGGAFACSISTLLQWKAAITHHSPGPNWVAGATYTPIRYDMNINDSHPDVGIAGNLEAFANLDTLTAREICSQIDLLLPQPVFPERFARVTDADSVGVSTSTTIFNELLTNGMLDANNYLLYSGNDIAVMVQTSPGSWPVITGLSTTQLAELETEINNCFAEHEYHNYYIEDDILFLKNLCLPTFSIQENAGYFDYDLFPNPFSFSTTLQTNKFLSNATLSVYNSYGQQVKQLKNISGQSIILYRDGLSCGLYLIHLTQDNKTITTGKLIITD